MHQKTSVLSLSLILVLVSVSLIESSFPNVNVSEIVDSSTPSETSSTLIDTTCGRSSTDSLGKRKDFETSSYSNDSSPNKKLYLKSILKNPMTHGADSKVLTFSSEIPDKMNLQALKNFFKSTSVRSSKLQEKFLSFAPEIEDRVIEMNNPNNDRIYWKAIRENDFSLARSIEKQGYLVLNYPFNCNNFQQILQANSNDPRLGLKKKIDYLALHQPHIFALSFECDESVFTGIHKNTANYIIQMYPYFRAAHESIFNECIRNPFLQVDDNFFINVNSNAACKRIDLAFASGRKDLIKKCCLLPKSVNCIKLNGQTIFTEAVLNRDLERIKLLNMRLNAGKSVLLKNLDDEDAIDSVSIDESDPEALVFCSLLSVLDSVLKSGNAKLLMYLISKFTAKARRLNKAALRAVKEKCLEIFLGEDLKKYVSAETELSELKTLLAQILTKQ